VATISPATFPTTQPLQPIKRLPTDNGAGHVRCSWKPSVSTHFGSFFCCSRSKLGLRLVDYTELDWSVSRALGEYRPLLMQLILEVGIDFCVSGFDADEAGITRTAVALIAGKAFLNDV
jgi:hypothetical protein